MTRIIKSVALLIAIMLFSVSSVLAASVTTVNVTMSNNVPLEETGQSGRVAWDQGVIEALGTGIPPANATSIAQSRALVRRAAIVDAYRNLAETIQGVQVDSETNMANLQITSDVVKTKVSGLIRGARIIREQAMPDGAYQVVMTIKLFGSDGLAGVALPIITPSQIQEFPVPTPVPGPARPTPVPGAYPSAQIVYTGVVVDARGLGLQPTFSPVIVDDTGRSIYGTRFIDASLAISKGMVDYAPTLELVQAAENGQSRAGVKPIIVKAISVSGNTSCNVVISKADADKILAANQLNNFLKNLAVVFED